MASLVPDYDSDSGSSTSESIEKNTSSEAKIPEDEDENTLNRVNFMTGQNIGDSDGEEKDKDEEAYTSALEYLKQKNAVPQGTKLPNPIACISLPSPTLENKIKSTINLDKDSVFTNKFQNAEDAKLSILEKHVKVTTIEKKDEVGGRKICWQYRKGRCKKGHRCKFAHDNDIPLNTSETNDGNEPTSHMTNSKSGSANHFKFGEGYFNQEIIPSKSDLPDEDSYMSNTKPKKRHGVRDGMVPPKRALNDLEKQRAEQRPWTMNP